MFLKLLIVSLVLDCNIKFCSSTCSRNVDSSCTNSQCLTDQRKTSEGIQFLIPNWNFSCQGTIEKWFAHVHNSSFASSGSIEFQIFMPTVGSNGDEYSLVYGNEYQGDDAQGSLISMSVSSTNNPPLIPIRPGYIVGVYLPPSNDTQRILELMYDNEGDTDVYYWTGIQSRKCQYSLCSGKVRTNVNLFIGWEFTATTLGLIQTILDAIKDDSPPYCQGFVQECINVTVASSALSDLPSHFSSHIETSTGNIIVTAQTSVTTSSLMIGSTTINRNITAAQTLVTTSSSMIGSTTSNESSSILAGMSDFQLALLVGVIVLLLLVVLLLAALMVLLVRRRQSKFKTSCFSAHAEVTDCSLKGHVNTAVNPSYKALAIPDKNKMENVTVNEDEMRYLKKQSEVYTEVKQSEIYTEVDEFQETSRKDYVCVKVEDYCVPCSSDLNKHFYETMYSDNRTRTELPSNQALQSGIYEEPDFRTGNF